MKLGLVTADSAATVADAARVMMENDVGSVLVTENGEPVGIFTERDVVKATAEVAEAATKPISRWTSRPLRTISPDAGTVDAVGMMVRGHFRHLPVEENGELIGIISMRDLMSLEPALRSTH
ncbi:MAG TPA: CBS domain-containing protein [Candidatus Dormibacteraeota bacterium]